jgi:hypothetical protein
MTNWKTDDAEYAKDFGERMDALTPEPLFESFLLPGDKVCLRCGQNRAASMLYSAMSMRPVLPLCASCASDWNLYGYRLLKGLSPNALLWRLTKFKLTHPFSRPSILEIKNDLAELQRWANKMKRLKVGD